jgi:CRP/FNR family cyclic AMP-dependent transcriptional regulator
MPFRTRGTGEHEPHWVRRPGDYQQVSAPTSTCLLDADDDLAQELDGRLPHVARQLAVVRVLDTEVDEDLSPWLEKVRDGPGLLILSGVVAFETRIFDRIATELLGAGDLLQPFSDRSENLLVRVGDWRVLSSTRFAMLDAEFAERVRAMPQIVQSMLRRTTRRSAEIDALRAITCQPRLEVRLVLLLWHLSARWGRVEPAGIRLCLPLTHRLLGQMVGAERPSITHALKRLGQAGLVTGTTLDLHLHGDLDHQLEALTERGSSHPEPEAFSEPLGRAAARGID